MQSARDLLQPMEVGTRFFLVPEWRDDPAPEGRFRIAVNPGMAFGTGVHETTQLVHRGAGGLSAAGDERAGRGHGLGHSGARRRSCWARGMWSACDTDPVAVEIARRRAFVGSVDAVASGAVDLVMANISPEAIAALAADLLRVRKAGGVLLASGFEGPEVDQVRAVLPEAREVRQKGKWALIVV